MPTRLVREGIISSEKVNALSWGAEVLYRRLLSVVDDYGRFSANSKLIRAACYPLRLEDVSDADVETWLSECCGVGLIQKYGVDGQNYLEIHKFGTPRAKKSKYPNPPTSENSCKQLQTDENISTVFVFESVSVSEQISEPSGSEISNESKDLPEKIRSSKNRGTRMSPDFAFPDDWLAWAMAEYPTWGAARIRRIFVEFRDFWSAVAGQRGVKLDWMATWRNRCRQVAEREGPGGEQDPMKGAV